MKSQSLNNKSPQVSIIMGVYNGVHHLRKCIVSIKAQTLQDWEFVICDDGSTDETLSVLKELQRGDARIKVIRNEQNQGLGESLNRCLAQSNSDVVARQDVDDTCSPNRLQLQLEQFLKEPRVSVLGTFAYLSDKGCRWGHITPPISPIKTDWVTGSKVIHASVFMKKSDVLEVGGYNPKAIRVEDLDLWLRLVAAGKIIMTMPKYLYEIQWSRSDYDRKKIGHRLSESRVLFQGVMRMKVCPCYLR